MLVAPVSEGLPLVPRVSSGRPSGVYLRTVWVLPGSVMTPVLVLPGSLLAPLAWFLVRRFRHDPRDRRRRQEQEARVQQRQPRIAHLREHPEEDRSQPGGDTSNVVAEAGP